MTTTMRDRFDDKFDWLISNNVSFMVLGEVKKLNTELTRQDLLYFIEQELKKEREEIVEMIEQINPEPSAWKDSLDGFKAVIINTIKNRV